MPSSNRFTRAISPAAMIIAVLAVVLAAAGAGYSAAQIGTKDIKNNAVTAKKVKDGTLAAKDMVKEQKVTKFGSAGAVPFSNGGLGDCMWLSGATQLPGLGDPAYRVDRFGTVHLSGIAVSGNGPGGDAMCDSSGEPEDGIMAILPPELRPASTLIVNLSSGDSMYIVGPTSFAGQLPAGAIYTGASIAFLDGLSYLPSTSPLVARPTTKTHIGAQGRALLHKLGFH